MFFAVEFLITLLSEYFTIVAIKRSEYIKYFLVVIGVNLLTHPVSGWLILSKHQNYYLIELLIIIVETLLYFLTLRTSLKTAFKYSFTANLVSIFVGLLILYVRWLW
jgi:hypothetical protein